MNRDRYINIRRPEDNLHANLLLHVRVWEGTETPFVLVHGLSSNCRTWDAVAHELAAAGHTVVSVDQRGHGLSDKPDDGYDFTTISADLAHLVRVMGLTQPILVGQSWGGNVMLELGARDPDLARGLGFVDGGTIDLQSRPDATWESTRERLTPPKLTGTPVVQMRQRMRNFHPDWSDEGIEATLANFELLPDETVRPWLTLDRHLKILRAMWEQRPAELYPRVKAPVLICAAEEKRNPDWMAVKEQQVDAAAKGLPLAAVHWFPETDHDIHVHRPAALAHLMLDTLRNGIWRA